MRRIEVPVRRARGVRGCGQVKIGACAGFHGTGSVRKTGTAAPCRLTVPDGRRAPRRYWDLGRPFFAEGAFRVQADGELCPFANPNFPLMRNFLFAAAAAGPNRAFAVVPERTAVAVRRQVQAFRETILRGAFRPRIGVATYDRLADLLAASRHDDSRALGRFLRERIATLAGASAPP